MGVNKHMYYYSSMQCVSCDVFSELYGGYLSE